MRRPSPLPSTPPAAPRRSAPTPTPETEPAAEAAPERVESAAPGRLAPVVPLEPTASSAAESNGTAPDAAADRPLGVRDVWAAARARRRALRREVRRFTVRQRRRRYAWLGALAAVVLLGVGAVGAAYSPLFAVSKITVIGTQKLAPAAIEQALAGEMGTPLALVDSSAVKAALVSFPLVESYSIEARPPQELVVRIIERTRWVSCRRRPVSPWSMPPESSSARRLRRRRGTRSSRRRAEPARGPSERSALSTGRFPPTCANR